MIEINLAREILCPPRAVEESYRSNGWIYIVLCFGIALSSWWWTQNKQLELDVLIHDRDVYTQSLVKIQTTLSRLEEYQGQAKLLRRTVQQRRVQVLGKEQPMVVLQGVKRSLDGLGIWLVNLQMIDQVVEIRGKSFSHQEIEEYINALENHQVIGLLPVVEILDHVDGEGEKLFSFVIRFVLESQVTA